MVKAIIGPLVQNSDTVPLKKEFPVSLKIIHSVQVIWDSPTWAYQPLTSLTYPATYHKHIMRPNQPAEFLTNRKFNCDYRNFALWDTNIISVGLA